MPGQWNSRRRVLKHAGIVGMLGLCGCTPLTDDSPPSGRRITDLSVTGLDSAPVSVTATATHSQITPEQTAQFEVTVTVERDGPVSLSFGNSIPFHAPKSSSPPGVILLQGTQYERESSDTWVLGETIPRPQNQLALHNVSAGSSTTESWAVWGDPNEVSYIEPGTYEFNSEITVDPPGESFRWTLSLTISTESPEE